MKEVQILLLFVVIGLALIFVLLLKINSKL